MLGSFTLTVICRRSLHVLGLQNYLSVFSFIICVRLILLDLHNSNIKISSGVDFWVADSLYRVGQKMYIFQYTTSME